MTNCVYCNQLIETPTVFIDRVHTSCCSSSPYKLYFCNDECMNLCKTIGECQICHNRANTYELIDGLRVCNLSEDWCEKPTCMERYTGNYQCFICSGNYNVNEHKCFIITTNIVILQTA